MAINITIWELIKLLEKFNDESKEVIVFTEELATIYEVISVSDNGGNAQLNII